MTSESGKCREKNSGRTPDHRPGSVAARLYAEKNGHTLESAPTDRQDTTKQAKPRLDGRRGRSRPEMRQLNTRISEDHYEKLYDYSRRTGLSFIEIIAELIEGLPEEENDRT